MEPKIQFPVSEEVTKLLIYLHKIKIKIIHFMYEYQIAKFPYFPQVNLKNKYGESNNSFKKKKENSNKQ